jgi:hypothetical protein
MGDLVHHRDMIVKNSRGGFVHGSDIWLEHLNEKEKAEQKTMDLRHRILAKK